MRVAFFLWIALAGCSGPTEHTSAILDGADRIEVLALGDRVRGGPEAPTGPSLDGCPILGRAAVRRHDLILRAIDEAIVGDDMSVPACFAPHHGIRGRVDGRWIEISICCSCTQMHILDETGPYHGIDPRPLRAAIEPLIEAQAHLAFDEEAGDFGAWHPTGASAQR